MTLSDPDGDRLGELRAAWHAARDAGDAERLVDIAALGVVLAVFPDAVVVEPTGTEGDQ